MIKNLTVLFFFCFAFPAFAQVKQGDRPPIDNRFVENQDTTRVNKEIQIKLSGETYFKDYKVMNFENDTTYIDTTLNIKKEYAFNFLKKDNLEAIAFANQGQTFNNLAYTFNKNSSLYPKIGARAQHYNFKEVEDVKYYYVPTPTTELMYRTGLEQGQILDAMFTFNSSKQFNFAIGLQGIRSLGKYRHTLSDHGNVRITMNYHTKNNRYNIRTHMVIQYPYTYGSPRFKQ
jgi:hypothetical protein